MIPQEYIQEVVRRNDIEEVIGQYVQLRRRGRTATGLCPFHNEKTPSFVVYPDTQSFYCFGCGAAGDVINFVRKYNNLGYVEAVKQLAGRAGMPLPEEDDRESRARQRLLEINRCAARYFYENLNAKTPEAAMARRYWKEKRGLSDAAIRRFGLGYAPEDFGGLLHYLKRRGFSEEELETSGLVKRSAKGNLYDIFRHRVMVPIIDVRGAIIAFGGRVLDDSKPKYINSPETMVYHKSRTLFALNIAKKSKNRRYILCEGYMDVISMHEAGFDTAVCACGTALTPEQAKLLSEYADEVVLSYDSDEAGQKATERSLGILGSTTLKVSVLSYQGAKDPDEFIKKYGRERFEMLLNGTANPTEFQLKKSKAKYDLRSDDGRLSYIREAIEILTERGVSPTARDVYAGRLADETGVSKQAILSQLNGALQAAARRSYRKEQRDLSKEGIASDIRVPYTSSGESALGAANAARQLAVAMLQDPEQVPYVRARLDMSTVLVPEMQRALEAIFRCVDEHLPLNQTSLQQMLDEAAFRQLAHGQAYNHDIRLQRQDIDMYLDRLQTAKPISEQVKDMSDGQLESYTPANADKVNAGWIDNDNTLFGYSASAVGVIYNTTVVPELSADWSELADAQYKDMIAIPDPEKSGACKDFLAGLVTGTDNGEAIMQSWADNGLTVPGANKAALEAVTTGEKGILIAGVDYNAYSSMAKGEPLNIYYPASGTVVNPRPAMILKTAPNMDNAKAFVDFLFSDEAQKLVADAYLLPGRSDVQCDSRTNLSDIPQITTDWDKMMEVASDTAAKLNSLCK